MTVTIQLTEEQSKRVQAAAERMGVKAEELAKVALDGLLARMDREFEEAASYVLSKNAELYRRLA